MHELAICQALIGQVRDVARSRQARRVSDIFVGVGPLSGVERPLMQSAFPIAAAGTVADQASLHLEAMPVRVYCKPCGKEAEADTNRLVCPACGNWQTQLVGGDELILRRVVMEECHV